ncbi:acyltransferase family protein [Mycobacterium sp. AZCC_0083]|uniref:acyltransferase family protein n=1 Tax=Mycobacterium sp. AZCC_0083 TaxID=2735882 RepID=UPI002107E44E|nr:acyltransferase family protein [Mycobacterium sp. AZCC_0083]
MFDHVFGWPRGGFIGVDVFFVISGFLITGILLRDAEKIGHVSFVGFYRRRVRRIVPAATLTLAAIAVAAELMFSRSRAVTTWWDTVAAFFFCSNWRFAIQGTDYFNAGGPISPVRHFWSLSVEEQFYFVWPAVMAVVVFLVTRKAMSLNARHRIAGAIMAALVAGSFTWAVLNTTSSPSWSYFSTLTRGWELGFGALLAIFAASMSKIPDAIRPALAWIGLAIIALGAFWITEDIGFPGPWAIVPVVGSGLVLAAGTGGAVRFLWPITNIASVTVGDLSYSLYLWHWPVIIFLGSIMEPAGWQYYVAAIGITAALSTFAYYFVEQPILASSWLKPRDQQAWRHQARRSRDRWGNIQRSLMARFTFEMTPGRQIAGVVAAVFLLLASAGLLAVPKQPPAYISAAAVDAGTPQSDSGKPLPPVGADLQQKIMDAVKAQAWPDLNPSMDAVVQEDKVRADLAKCGTTVDVDCWFGEDAAPHTMVLVGDSIGMSYLPAVIAFVNASDGQWKLLNQALLGCEFVNADVKSYSDEARAQCSLRKQRAIDSINQLHPDVVLISNRYNELVDANTQKPITDQEYQSSVRDIINRFAGSAGKVALLTAPPDDKSPSDCYRADGSPADCVGRLTQQYLDRIKWDTSIAHLINGELIDTTRLFCTPSNYCPIFAGTTPMKVDARHISSEYGDLMSPAFTELLRGTATFNAAG